MARILIIEDETATRMVMEEALSTVGHIVFLAANGNQGLKLCRAEQVDLIVTDIYMPDMEGLEFIKSLRQEKAHVPIIAVSGNPDFKSALQVARRLGAVKTLPKPFQPQELRAAVSMVLQRGSPPGPMSF